MPLGGKRPTDVDYSIMTSRPANDTPNHAATVARPAATHERDGMGLRSARGALALTVTQSSIPSDGPNETPRRKSSARSQNRAPRGVRVRFGS